jgi:hypothetical protein
MILKCRGRCCTNFEANRPCAVDNHAQAALVLVDCFVIYNCRRRCCTKIEAGSLCAVGNHAQPTLGQVDFFAIYNCRRRCCTNFEAGRPCVIDNCAWAFGSDFLTVASVYVLDHETLGLVSGKYSDNPWSARLSDLIPSGVVTVSGASFPPPFFGCSLSGMLRHGVLTE